MTGEALRSADPVVQRKYVEAYLRQQIAGALGIPSTRLDPSQPVNTLGLDSMMIYEVKRCVRTDLGAALSAVRFFEKVTIPELASELAGQLMAVTESDGEPGAEPPGKSEETKALGRERRRRGTVFKTYWRGIRGRSA